MSTALVLRHVPFEDLGLLEPLLLARGYQVILRDAPLAPLDALPLPDLLVVLGGPIGAFDDAAYPFLTAELALIRRQLKAGRPILGICLGAQLMARALGAKVQPMAHKEIGYAPLALTPEGLASPLAALDGVPVLHWHGDQFEVPAGAQLLASTPVCAQQAFALGSQVLGLQFHLEVVPQQLEAWLVGHACELAQVGIDPRILRAQARLHGAALAPVARAVLSQWLDQVVLPT